MGREMDPDSSLKMCVGCHGRHDRPGLYGCKKGCHQAPTLAQRIAADIESDITNRRGLRQAWEGIDVDLQVEIRDKWVQLVEQELTVRAAS